MKLKESAIWQMFNGLRGRYEDIPTSEEYEEAKEDTIEKIDALADKLKKYPELLELFSEVLNATDKEHMIYADDVYREGFSFGVVIGREIFTTAAEWMQQFDMP